MFYIYNINSYEKEFSKNNAYEKYNKTFVDDVGKNLINYFKSNEELGNYYSQREILHLEDVKNLIRKTLTLFYITFTFLLLSFIYLATRKYYNELSKILIYGGIICILLIFLFVILFFIDFNSSFIKFHEIFFNNDLWILSSESLLVNLFTEEFFFNILKKILITSIVFSLISITSGIIIQKAYKSTSAKQ